MENKTTDEQMFSMRLKTFVPMVFAIIIGTNTVSFTLQRISIMEDKEIYNQEADKRRLKNQAKEFEYRMKIHKLEEDLSDCSKSSR